MNLRWGWGWRFLGERERRWRGLGEEDGYGREGGTGGGGEHGAAVARLMAPGGSGVVVAGAGGVRWVWAAGGTGSLAGSVGEGEVDVGLRWRAWRRWGERERWWRGLGVGVVYGRRGEGGVDMQRRWRS